MIMDDMSNKYNALIKEAEVYRGKLGITFYLLTDKETKMERKPRENILIERGQKW
jgi:hypothetical protein